MSSRRLLSGASRKRNHASSSSAAASTSTSTRAPELPEYEAPTCPLDGPARKALSELSTNRDTRRYAEQLAASLKHLSDSVRDLNDGYADRRERLRGLQERRHGGGGSGAQVKAEEKESAEAAAVQRLRGVVPDLTRRSERAVRDVIDWRNDLEDGKEALQHTVQAAEQESSRLETRHKERQERKRARDEAMMEGNEDEDGEEDGEGSGRAAKREARKSAAEMDEGEEDEYDEVEGPLRILEKTRRDKSTEYAGKSLYERYALDNDYIAFKRLWHDAAHKHDARALPDPSRWFRDDVPQEGDGDDDAEEEQDDDELIVANENLSMRCPLSMEVMKDPHTSRVCNHTYDKENIVSFIKQRPRGETAKCPQTGCDAPITLKDLYPDAIMLRRIKRALDGRGRGNVDYDDDEMEDDGVGDVSMAIMEQRNIKAEREARAGKRRVADDIEDDDDDESPAQDDTDMADA